MKYACPRLSLAVVFSFSPLAARQAIGQVAEAAKSFSRCSELSKRDRSLITETALIADGHTEQLPSTVAALILS